MTAGPRTLIIVNPVAGQNLVDKTLKCLDPRLKAAFPGLEIRRSEHLGQAIEIGREAARAGYGRILCLGGNGTPFEVVNGLYSDFAPPAIRNGS